jgi:uncharacterized protein (TIGR02266 family)
MSDEPKRQYLRHALDAKIDVIEGSLGVKIRFETQNVSSGGVFIESDLLYDEGEIIWFSFTLPGALEIRTRGRVVWAKKEVDPDDPEDRPGMGVEFLDLSAGEKAALEEYLTASYIETE